MAHDPREPFAPDEAELARVYAALPRIEPSPALDARVLAHARAAVTSTPKRKSRPWYLMPATGAAAAAVLAAGIGWQVGLFEQASVSERATVPAPAAAMKQEAPQEAEERKSVDIDYVRKESAQPSAAEAEVQAPPAAKPRRAMPAAPPPAPPPSQTEAKRLQEFVPEPPEQDAVPPVVLDEATPMSTPAPEPIAPAATQAAPAADTAASASDALGAAAGAGRDLRSRDAALPPWRQDARLAPDAWLDRIRERVRLGDRQGAQFSLRKFQLDHPTRAIPAELQRLLVE